MDVNAAIKMNENQEFPSDQYNPLKLPFFKEVEEKPTQSFIKLKKTKSEKPDQKTVADLFKSENSQETILI